MSRVILSHLACDGLRAYLQGRGHTLVEIEDDPRYGAGVASHADLRYCAIGPGGPVLKRGAPPRSPAYPDNAAMCAVALDGFLIHRLDITDPGILRRCRERGFREINVRQGYTRCSCLPVDGRSVITSDPGIFSALSGVPGLDVLRVREGHVALPGYDRGFIGGTTGRVGDEVLFNGDLSRHPDFLNIKRFIESRGLAVRYFRDVPLTDVGSIIEEL